MARRRRRMYSRRWVGRRRRRFGFRSRRRAGRVRMRSTPKIGYRL